MWRRLLSLQVWLLPASLWRRILTLFGFDWHCLRGVHNIRAVGLPFSSPECHWSCCPQPGPGMSCPAWWTPSKQPQILLEVSSCAISSCLVTRIVLGRAYLSPIWKKSSLAWVAELSTTYTTSPSWNALIRAVSLSFVRSSANAKATDAAASVINCVLDKRNACAAMAYSWDRFVLNTPVSSVHSTTG